MTRSAAVAAATAAAAVAAAAAAAAVAVVAVAVAPHLLAMVALATTRTVVEVHCLSPQSESSHMTVTRHVTTVSTALCNLWT